MFIKICGITGVSDARMVAAAGASAIGLNFFPPSPRSVSISTAQEIVQNLPPYVTAVGLFVNSTSAEIRQVADAVGLRTLQIHGNCTPELVAELREFTVVAAFSLSEQSGAAAVFDLIAACQRLGRMPGAVMVDAYSQDKFGGTGQVAPWQAGQEIVQKSPVPVLLAGGLTPKNVAQAIRTVRPWGVDVATGVEVAPGRKESYKVKRFIEEATSAFRLL